MPTTSNFGWTTPADTDLVKDGALAIRTLGNGIDTSFLDLKGGTTGQLLSKASNTDLDYTWVSPTTGDITSVNAGTGISGGGTSGDVTITNSMATAIDAKGDLIAGTGADAFSRLAVGTNGQYLSADSTAATGLSWVTPASGALVKIASGTISGTSMSFDNVFSSTYDNYLICWLVRNCDGEQRLRFRVSGTDDTNANYRYSNMEIAAATTPSWAAQGGGVGTTYALGLPAGTGSIRYGFYANVITPFDSAVVTTYTGFGYAGPSRYLNVGGGVNDNKSFDGFTIYNTGSTFTGSYQIYGYAK